MSVYEVLIVGAGPAGLSTALALAQIHRTCIVFSDSVYRNEGVTAAHSIITRDHTHPQTIRDLAKKDIEKFGNTTFVETSITKIKKTGDGFEAENADGQQWKGKAVVLATGVKDVFPDLPGYAENWPANMYVYHPLQIHTDEQIPMYVLRRPLTSPSPQRISLLSQL